MMDRLDKETEAVAAAPVAPLSTIGSPAIYTLPAKYRKQIRYTSTGPNESLQRPSCAYAGFAE